MAHKPDLISARSALLGWPGVVGVGYGLKETGGKEKGILAWRVYVRVKRPINQLRFAERIPAHLYGLPTDVIAQTRVAPASGTLMQTPDAGAKISNSKGVPGTLGCLAHTLHDDQLVLLSNWHVLFGNGGQEDGKVWLVTETGGKRNFSEIGKTLYGKIGTVRFAGEDQYVDCAVSSCLGPPEPLHRWPLVRRRTRQTHVTEHEVAQPGDRITKTGAATGTTTGVVVDADYPDIAWIENRSYAASQQLLMKTIDGNAFSTEGDSGAVILNSAHKAVGLLWGTNSRGEGIACQIGPVLQALNIGLGPPPQTHK